MYPRAGHNTNSKKRSMGTGVTIKCPDCGFEWDMYYGTDENGERVKNPYTAKKCPQCGCEHPDPVAEFEWE